VGERGVGKECLARAIHARSARAQGPFRVVELRGVPAVEVEATLFGTRRGGGGLVADCPDGTLFLAGGEALARSLELRIAFSLRSRAASTRSGPGPRIIIGTAGLHALTRRYPGRDQLADIVGAERLPVPPLRERREEMPDLIDRLVADAGRIRGVAPGITAEQRLAWCGRDWPGNIRELRNEIDRAVAGVARAVASGAIAEVITQRIELPPGIEGGERERIMAALVVCAFNQSRAAAHLRMSRRTLLTRLDQLGIERPLKAGTPTPTVLAGKEV
jgi:two-component system C4-dicarboxylate transport response regulator DctD